MISNLLEDEVAVPDTPPEYSPVVPLRELEFEPEPVPESELDFDPRACPRTGAGLDTL